MGIVVCKLPKAGLGNQLFPLMKAFVFGELNKQDVVVVGYHQLKIGPYLRREKQKRKYSGYFLFQKNVIREWLDKNKMERYSGSRIAGEAPLRKYPENELKNGLFQYSEIPHYGDYFAELRNHRALVKELLWAQLRPAIRERIEKQPSPVIGVHIRMGDFRKLKENEDFKNTGHVRTPEEYFIQVIRNIRKIHGTELPVFVFTDGYRNELGNLLSMDAVTLIEGNPDIVDMFVLSRSRIIVAAAGSTFSYWAGFLSDAPLILHPDHIHAPIRLPNENPALFEGVFDDQNGLLKNAIVAI